MKHFFSLLFPFFKVRQAYCAMPMYAAIFSIDERILIKLRMTVMPLETTLLPFQH
jgi:hypothetical protein